MFAKSLGTMKVTRDDLEGMVMNHVRHTYKSLAFESTQLPEAKYSFTEKQYKKFELALFPGGNFNVRTFDQVGMINPFPTEPKDVNFKIPAAPLDLVYAKSRYFEGQSPPGLYIPSRKLMWKIMRACADVADEKDLWFVGCKSKESAF